jgi:hypothetical protein
VAANEAISPRNQNPLSAQFHATELTGAAEKLEAKSQAARGKVRIADFSMAVTVVDHVVARPPQFWGFMEAIFEVWGCSAGGVK